MRAMRSIILIGIILVTMNVGVAHAADREFGAPQFLGSGFSLPAGVAYDAPRNRIIVLTAGDHRLAYASIEDARAGAPWTIIGEVSDRSAAAAMNEPQGVAVDGAGNIFVADTFNNQARLFRYDAGTDSYAIDTSFTADTRTSVDGVPISLPRDIAVGADGAVYLLDSGNQRVLRAAGADARRFTVAHRGVGWSEPYGLDVDESGALYIADTDNHRIIRIAPGGEETAFGRFGRDRGGLRYPKDVGVDARGRLFVADTHNHRIAIYDSDFGYYRKIGAAPLIRNPESIAIGPAGEIFIADIEREDALAFLGPDVSAQFNGYIRDNASDIGAPPTPAGPDAHASPDILVSFAGDLDPTTLATSDFDELGSEAVIPGGAYFLYFGVNNSGARPLPPGSVSIYTNTTDSSEPLYDFPDEWRDGETFVLSRGEPGTDPAHMLSVPEVPGGTGGAAGRTIVGPLQWRPTDTTESCDSQLYVMARLVNLYDPVSLEIDNGLEQARVSDNIAVKSVPFVAARCIPTPDRYEPSEELSTAARVTERWSHLKKVCPRWVVRGSGTYPEENSCPGIFEDGVAPRAAEEIWTLSIPNLSLHSGLDRDFFRAALPDFTDPAYEVNDINTRAVRDAFSDLDSYTPATMPECGSVRRTDPGPRGADRRTSVNVATEFLIEVVPEGPPANDVAPRPVETAGEQLFGYTEGEDGVVRDMTVFSGGRYSKRVVCPKDLHDLDEIVFSFGEREPVTARELTATGGYRINMKYVSMIDRGVPPWAEDPGITGRLDCFGLRPIPFGGPGGRFGGASSFGGFPAGSRFPFCGFDLLSPGGFFERHPRLPTPECIVDGPGCFSQFYFYWPGGAILNFGFLAETPLLISLIDEAGQAVSETTLSGSVPIGQLVQFQDADLTAFPSRNGDGSIDLLGGQLFAADLAPGYYGLKIEGPASAFAFGFQSLPLEFETNANPEINAEGLQ